ncbi:hypothetical protein A3840_01025 [Devosia elaeis]|uniref:Uncharacterized protein n=2 Tax=Devosia elaeis TaxID=1770058 RepID=A0A178I4G1_9HYPH|nr:hypothetical protein A3840_01025 [Devosia elaeis]
MSMGMLLGRHVAEAGNAMAIDHDTPAWLSAFAQTSMSDTFSLGVSYDVYSSLMGAVSKGLRDFSEELKTACGVAGTVPDKFDEIVTKARDAIGSAVLDRAGTEHAQPLRRVLGVLPVDEMAELAETLINLQSLKEKVTKPSETVGGPIDVAVITKGEGMVWLKRKHFFDPGLNSRYMLRQSSLYK